MLTRKQNGIYRPLVKRAYRAYCDKGGCLSYEEWYRRQLIESELGICTTKQIKEAHEFDILCLHFAVLLNDQTEIDYWSRAVERRALWMLKETMKKADVGWPYVKGIARNMNFGDREIRDMPAKLILKLNSAVYLHMKRKEKHACI